MWSMGTLQFGGGPGGTYVCDLVVQQSVIHMLAHVTSRECVWGVTYEVKNSAYSSPVTWLSKYLAATWNLFPLGAFWLSFSVCSFSSLSA